MPDSSLVSGSAIAEVAQLARQGALVQRETILGRQFADRPMVRITVDPALPAAVDFATLGGFVNFVEQDFSSDKYLVHVASPTMVRLLGPLVGEDENLRAMPATATCKSAGMLGFRFDCYQPLEMLNIALQTCFAPGNGEIEELRKFCAAVRSTQETGVADDGVSQTVQARRGVAAVQTTAVKNPWLLAPYRTFSEIEQPLSPFVLRFADTDDPEAALFQTGDLSWQVFAISDVATELRRLFAALGKPEWTVLG